MRNRIFRSTFLVAALVLLSCTALIMSVLYNYYTGVQKKQMKAELAFAAAGVEGQGIDYLRTLQKENERLTLVAADGTVLFDTRMEASALENHGDREEFKEAELSGYGESSRYSTTLTEELLYMASRLSDGTVLRIAVSRMTPAALLLGMLRPIAMVIGIALILSALLAARAAAQIAAPLNRLDLDHPLENDTYEEVAPMLSKIQQGLNELERKKAELEQREEEFDAVTRNMDEGLVLLNQEGNIVFLNPAAGRFYRTGEYAVGKSFLTLDRNPDTDRMLDRAREQGCAEWLVEADGREYQLHANAIMSGPQRQGIVLLLFDVTEKAFAEQNRREFTANVSHELKTPLQSIMGSAELIKSGLAGSEDIPRFAGVIYREARRLVALIEDIIRLSGLDEQVELPEEDVAVRELVDEEIAVLSPLAARREIRIHREGEEVWCRAPRQLLQAIIFNLCDNAVKYNRDGGKVSVRTVRDGEDIVLSVSDQGIGISPEHQSRIFERFYRVDKSRSKASGGTGLGLSIVKHAVQYMHGEISLESRVGSGTVITVRIPANRPVSLKS